MAPGSRQDVRGRLQQAALELFQQRGYDATTSAEIAARAGVTERTFFRHFADKREILFEEDPRLRPTLTVSVADAPEAMSPLQVVLRALASLQPMLEANRPFTEPRMALIAAAPARRERAEATGAAGAALLAAALQRRGVEERLAGLAARTGMAAFGYAASAWREDPSRDLEAHLARALEALQALSSPGAAGGNP
ncbi:MAG: helix-turn-helix domain-containing protein [Phenylobacterium sp.]